MIYITANEPTHNRAMSCLTFQRRIDRKLQVRTLFCGDQMFNLSLYDTEISSCPQKPKGKTFGPQ